VNVGLIYLQRHCNFRNIFEYFIVIITTVTITIKTMMMMMTVIK